MTQKRMGEAWIPAADYGRAMPKFSLNLLVRDVERSLPFYKEILGATVAMKTPPGRRNASACGCFLRSAGSAAATEP